MKVCLVAPPNPSMLEPRIAPPLGLLYLVGWANHFHPGIADFEVIDLNTRCHDPANAKGHSTHDFSLTRCMKEIPTGCEIYGMQLASMQMPHGISLAKLLRQREPQALIVCGGSHASAVPDECSEDFDVVITQEGEIAFSEILHAWKQAISHMGPSDDLSREILAARNRAPGEHGKVLLGKKIEPLDQCPYPAREYLDFTKYVRKVAGESATNIITSRGCPARCIFCQQDSLWGRGLRIMSTERILAEVDDIYEKTGIRNLLFLDDSLTARKRTDMIALAKGLGVRGVKWRGWTRANLCARDGEAEVLQAMADGGCQALCIGVEAGSEKVLKAVGKGTTVEHNRIAIQRIKDAGMYARTSIMVGNPNEDWDDVEQLIQFIAETQPDDWILSSFVPLPGTPSWDRPEDFGIILDKEKAKREQYRHFFVVGGDEQSGLVHRYDNGVGPEEIQLRHDYVQEALLRLAPRDRIRVTIGKNVDPTERHAS